MTDSAVKEFLINRFKEKMADFLTIETENDKNKYTNLFLENETVERPEDGYWYQVSFMPTPPVPESLGMYSRNRWVSVMQIDICVPLNIGVSAMEASYEAIFKAFPNRCIENGIRIKSVSRSSARQSGDYCSMAVSVLWEADLEN